MNDRSTLLLEHHLKELKLPSFLREYGKMAAQCAAEGVDHPQYLLRLSESLFTNSGICYVETITQAGQSCLIPIPATSAGSNLLWFCRFC